MLRVVITWNEVRLYEPRQLPFGAFVKEIIERREPQPCEDGKSEKRYSDRLR